MLTRIPFVLVLSIGLVAVAVGDDDKKSKLPPMIFVGNVDGVLVMVDEGSDRIVLSVKDLVPTQVPAYGPQRLMNGGSRTVMKEQIVQKSFNLSPDVVIRLMNKRPETPPKPDKKKTDKSAKKDEAAKESKDGDSPDKGEKGGGDKAQGGGPGGGGPGGASGDPNAKLGGIAGKKSQLAKGQLVRLALARNADRNNPQNYVIVVYVLSDGR